MTPSRRTFLTGLGAAAGTSIVGAANTQPTANQGVLLRPVPSSGEKLPAVGLGSWITFNVGNDAKLLEECTAVVRAFFAAGGRMIDSSPMYASSQPTIGHALRQLGFPSQLLSAEKVWISDAARGREQIERSRGYWGVPKLDLVQVHNLLSWQRHLTLLKTMKAQGEIRYVGITTSEGRRHQEFEKVMAAEPLDFIQITYNPVDREVEQRILPLARERGIAVIVNRPFQQGDLIRHVEKHKLPTWASDVGANSWAQLILKFIISHPAVTCAIPATTRVDHVTENVAAASGPLPDDRLRERISAHIRQL